MKSTPRRPFTQARRAALGRLMVVPLLIATTISHAAAAMQTQTVTLLPGWNAIWLEVSPISSSGEGVFEQFDSSGLTRLVEDTFTDENIDIVTRPVSPVGTAEFISDPAETFNQEGWMVWHRNSSSGNSLTRMRGNQAYLVHNRGKTTISHDITGEVNFFVPGWAPSNYNLLGFTISGSPTFGDFFGAAGESGGLHPISKLFELDSATGHWESVQPTDVMTPGAAYWIFSERNSTFAGQVAIAFDGIDGIDFGRGPGDLNLKDAAGDDLFLTSRELTFTNVGEDEHSVTLTKVAPATTGAGANGDDLRVYRVVPVPGELEYTLETGFPLVSETLVDLAAKHTQTVTVGASRGWSSGDPSRENLYRIEVALGGGGASQYFWLPVTATRSDIQSGSNSSGIPEYAGLWVGQLNITEVTSIAETGNPVVATTSTLPLQIIVHVDASGSPSLLSHVLFMRTKTADENTPNEPVLVLDEDKIPFFEGIALRDGKRVGRRIETVAYDMPLVYNTAIQEESLLLSVAKSLGHVDANGDPDPTQVTDAELETYTLAATSRPAGFVEDYALSWPLSGGVAPGLGLSTGTDASLRLDPYHRSNPFRHAFHPRHGTGIQIIRTMTISFDDSNNDADGLLTGTYTETIDGLTNLPDPLVARGSITLRRVSNIKELQ